MKLYQALTLIVVLSITRIIYPQQDEYGLGNMIERAMAVSPKIKMLEAKKQGAENRIPQVSNLPDPMLTLGVMNLPTNSFSFTEEPMTGKVIGLSQAFPFPGKLGAAENVLGKDVAIIQKEVDDAKNEIARDVKQNYYELLLTKNELRITDENKKLLSNAIFFP